MRAKHAISEKKWNSIQNKSFYLAYNWLRKDLKKLSELFDSVLQKISVRITFVNDLMIRGAPPPAPLFCFSHIKKNTFKQIALVRDLIIRGALPPVQLFFYW